jgi:hypothetical protein
MVASMINLAEMNYILSRMLKIHFNIFEKDLNLSDEHTRNVNNTVIILRQSITIVNIIL